MTYKTTFISLLVLMLLLAGVFFYRVGLKASSDMYAGVSGVEAVLEDGDIIFHTSRSAQSAAIQMATDSRYSHMGIIYKKGGQVYVFEAVQPVKMTRLSSWIKRGEGGHYVVKRLKKSDQILTPAVKVKMRRLGERFMGKDYDLYFGWSDNRIYCSELVWKIYKEAAGVEIGKLEKLQDFDLSNKVVKDMLAKRYGSRIPMKETVISPQAMFESEKLETVYEE